MKLQSNLLLENLTATELKNLATDVKETLASNFKKGKRKIFHSAQLWDIRRRKRNLQRAYF